MKADILAVLPGFPAFAYLSGINSLLANIFGKLRMGCPNPVEMRLATRKPWADTSEDSQE